MTKYIAQENLFIIASKPISSQFKSPSHFRKLSRIRILGPIDTTGPIAVHRGPFDSTGLFSQLKIDSSLRFEFITSNPYRTLGPIDATGPIAVLRGPFDTTGLTPTLKLQQALHYKFFSKTESSHSLSNRYDWTDRSAPWSF